MVFVGDYDTATPMSVHGIRRRRIGVQQSNKRPWYLSSENRSPATPISVHGIRRRRIGVQLATPISVHGIRRGK